MFFIEQSVSYGDYVFDYELDKGGDPDFPILIWINKKENPKQAIGKRYFRQGTSERHLHNFMKKVASDMEYRKRWIYKGGDA